FVVLVGLVALVASLLPVHAVAQAAASVDFEVAGLDDLAPDARGVVSVTTQIAQQGDLTDTDPLRLVGTLVKGGTAVSGLRVDVEDDAGGWATTATDGRGRFFSPPPGDPPLMLATDGDLLRAAGHLSRLAMTLPEGGYDLQVQLVRSDEVTGAVTRV